MSTSSARALTVTAQYTAAVRARESERTDALFSDPLAALLAGEEGFAWLDRLGPSATLWPVIRTRFLDDLLRNVPLKQVVLVAAGFDTRAYRLPWAEGTCLYEIDQPDVMQHKDSVLTAAGLVPQCRRIPLSADLRKPWADLLIAAGFSADQPAVWIVEGLLMYLDRAAAQHVTEAASRLAGSGSCLGLDLPERSLGGPEVADPKQWLWSLGWKAVVRELPEVAASYGRPPHRPYTPSGRARVFLIAARKG